VAVAGLNQIFFLFFAGSSLEGQDTSICTVRDRHITTVHTKTTTIHIQQEARIVKERKKET
jgi:hypothetical protein